MSIEPSHQRLANGLDDEVDMPGLAISVRPETRIHLASSIAHLGRRQPDGPGDKRERRTEVGHFVGIEIAEMHDVPSGFHDHRPYPEWADAMLNDPAADRCDAPTWNVLGVFDEVTCHAAHVSQRRAMSREAHVRRRRGVGGWVRIPRDRWKDAKDLACRVIDDDRS